MPARIANPAQSLNWRQWYGLLAWKKRQRYQLQAHPLCAACMRAHRVTAATIADHDPPHKGDWNAFRLGPLQSLFVDCHKGKWADDRRGYSCDIGADGYPIDPRHPFNRRGTVQRTSDGGPAAGELRRGTPGVRPGDPLQPFDRLAVRGGILDPT
jgi:5-methylcytosine-specific restriction protein A